MAVAVVVDQHDGHGSLFIRRHPDAPDVDSAIPGRVQRKAAKAVAAHPAHKARLEPQRRQHDRLVERVAAGTHRHVVRPGGVAREEARIRRSGQDVHQHEPHAQYVQLLFAHVTLPPAGLIWYRGHSGGCALPAHLYYCI